MRHALNRCLTNLLTLTLLSDKMERKDLFFHITRWFSENMETAESELNYDSPFHLLIAVILSAQCTDRRVNMHTPAIFARFPEPKDLAEASFEEVYEMIKSISFPNNKAKHLIGMAQMLVKEFDGEVPSTLEELVRLPGVGRKTANVIQSVVWGKAAFAVDTHVFRVSHRIGLVPARCTTPYSVEMELTKHIPDHLIPIAHHWLILHGRYTCIARKPKCEECGLNEYCKYYKKR